MKLIQFNELNNIDFKINKNTKIVSFEDYNLDNFKDEADIVYINKGDFGRLKFNNENFDFYGKAMIYGVIFSINNNFACASQKLFKKASVISNIYYNKALYLQDCCSKIICNYNNIANDLKLFSELFKQQNLDMNNINLLSQSIISKNNDLFNRDCRVVF